MSKMDRNVRGLLRHGSTLLFFIALSGFVFVLTLLENQRHQKFTEYETDRLGEELLRNVRDGLIADNDDLPSGVAGLGLYSPGGYPFILLGSMPSSVDPQVFLPEKKFYWIDIEDGASFLVKPLLPPPRPGIKGDLAGFLVVHVLDTASRNYPLTLWLVYALGQITLLGLLAMVWGLQNRNRILAEQLKLREEANFLADVGSVLAHEIKNPLSTILLQARSLSDHSEFREEAEIIAQETLRITELVERVKDLVRDPKGKPQVVDLLLLLQATPYAKLKLDSNQGEFKITMDALRLRSILDNIIQNAKESLNTQDPAPSLLLARRDKQVILEIVDRGTGFPPNQTQRLFTPFFTTKSAGIGLGLALARRFMEASGGTIEIFARDGGGTVAHLEWKEAP